MIFDGAMGSRESRPDSPEVAPPARHIEAPDVQSEDVSAAVQFVRLCGRATLNPREALAVHESGVALLPDEWLHVVHIAAASGMVPLVFLQAARAGLLQTMPTDVATALADGCRQTLVTNRSLLRQQQELLSALEARGIQAIVLKGLSLAVRYYQEIGLRPTSDVDLLVRRSDLQRADQVLRELGYQTQGGRPTIWNDGDLSYTSPKGHKLELHWELTHRPSYRIGLSAKRAWARAQTVDVANQPMRVLSASDELRFLCVHCTAGHRLRPEGPRLIWHMDIAQVVRTLPSSWDWPAFVEDTIALRLAAPVYQALNGCQASLGLRLPPDALDRLRDASTTQAERDAWHASQRDSFSAETLQSLLSAASNVTQVIAFLKGVVLPGSVWLRERYGRQNGRQLPLWHAYVLYLRRVLKRLPELVGTRKKR